MQQNVAIFAGLCLKRLPVVCNRMNLMEEKVFELKQKLELENSYLSKHEFRHVKEKAQFIEKKRDTEDDTQKFSEGSLMTAMELETQWEIAAEKITVASKITEFDEPIKVKSAWRSLDQTLYLLVKQKLGSKAEWSLPVVTVPRCKSLQEAVNEFSFKLFPKEAGIQMVNYIPSAVHKYKYKSKDSNQKQLNSVQMYFYNAYIDKLWKGEEIQYSSDIIDHAWISIKDFPKFIVDKNYLKSLQSFIIEY